ncbi:hypothetical protein Q7P37_010308 [Cladosporium fusiforme]
MLMMGAFIDHRENANLEILSTRPPLGRPQEMGSSARSVMDDEASSLNHSHKGLDDPPQHRKGTIFDYPAPSTSDVDEESQDPHRQHQPQSLCLQNVWQEIGIVSFICISQILDEYLMSGFIALMPTLMREMNISNTGIIWPASITPLIISAYLLPFGRLADMYGGFRIYMAGLAWVVLWSLFAGFSDNTSMLISCRAMQGLGSAAHLPAGLAILGKLYRPGRRKNIVYAVYGCVAPFASLIGVLVAGLVSCYADWPWFFWIAALLGSVCLIGSYLTMFRSRLGSGHSNVSMDWLGSLSLSTTLILFVFAITELADAPQGWRSPYILATGIPSLIGLVITIFVEGRSDQPLLPLSVFRIRYMAPLSLALLMNYGAFGLYMCYTTLYIREVLTIDPMMLVAWLAPMAVGGCLLALAAGGLMHVVSGTIILVLTSITIMAASLLFIFIPENPDYWAWVFPSMVLAAMSIDPAYNVANVFLSTKLEKHQQGLAGALSHALVQFGTALLLGVGKIVVSYSSDQEESQSYRNVFWLQFSCGAAALIVISGLVRVEKTVGDVATNT